MRFAVAALVMSVDTNTPLLAAFDARVEYVAALKPDARGWEVELPGWATLHHGGLSTRVWQPAGNWRFAGGIGRDQRGVG